MRMVRAKATNSGNFILKIFSSAGYLLVAFKPNHRSQGGLICFSLTLWLPVCGVWGPCIAPGPFYCWQDGSVWQSGENHQNFNRQFKYWAVNILPLPQISFSTFTPDPNLHKSQIYTGPKFTQKNKFGSGVNVENVNLGQRQYCNTSFTEWWQCAVSFCEELDITNISNVKSFFSTLDVSLQRKKYLKQNQFARMQFFKPLQSTLCLASFTILYSTFLNLTAT